MRAWVHERSTVLQPDIRERNVGNDEGTALGWVRRRQRVAVVKVDALVPPFGGILLVGRVSVEHSAPSCEGGIALIATQPLARTCDAGGGLVSFLWLGEE